MWSLTIAMNLFSNDVQGYDTSYKNATIYTKTCALENQMLAFGSACVSVLLSSNSERWLSKVKL